MKIFRLFLVSCAVTAILAGLGVSVEIKVIAMLYGISGMLLVVSMMLILKFSISGVINKNYIFRIKSDIKQERFNFILLFYICTGLFITDEFISYSIAIEVSNFIFSFTLMSVVYFVCNCVRIQYLKKRCFRQASSRKEIN